MGSFEQHMERARENEAVAGWLFNRAQGSSGAEQQALLRWVVTTTFYSAFHLVHARLDRWRPAQHPERHTGPGGVATIVSESPGVPGGCSKLSPAVL